MCFHIRKSADQSLFAAPHSLSQLVTSFIGSWCQGIHLMLFFAWTSYFGSHILELLEFQNMGFIFSHLKGFPFSALFVCNSTLRWNRSICYPQFQERPWSFWLCNRCFKNLLISKSFVFFLTICSFLYSFFIRFSKNKSSTQSLLCWSVWVDSNHRPRAYQARALTTWATDRYCSGSLSDPCLPGEVSFTLVEMMGIEPMTPCLQGRCSPSWATPPGLSVFQRSHWKLNNSS